MTGKVKMCYDPIIDRPCNIECPFYQLQGSVRETSTKKMEYEIDFCLRYDAPLSKEPEGEKP